MEEDDDDDDDDDDVGVRQIKYASEQSAVIFLDAKSARFFFGQNLTCSF